jgi:hypothetical protein
MMTACRRKSKFLGEKTVEIENEAGSGVTQTGNCRPGKNSRLT